MILYFSEKERAVRHAPDMEDQAGGYYIVGDAQTQIEGPVKREQIFALITKVRRKEKWLEPGDFWWEFFEHVWLHMISLRRGLCGVMRR